ncbi:MAG: methyltransferase [Oscillospiraceae bacterium]|nr:methyltransferase [Oscillospiraceae bacterium]
MLLKENEHIEYISDRLRLIVSPEHTFGTDALLLAAFALPKKNDKVCDLGTGCGIIPFYWLSRDIKCVTAVEIQEKAVNQLSRSVVLSEISDRVNIVHSDLRELKKIFPSASFNKITMNPPYTKSGHGIESSLSADKIARHENAGALPEICRIAAYLLNFGGSFSICLRPERLTDAFFAMRESGIEPKRLRFVSKNAETAPWLFLLEGKKGRNSGLEVMKPLFIQTPDGEPSEELLSITENYRK